MANRRTFVIGTAILSALLLPEVGRGGESPVIPPETPAEAQDRHRRVAERRQGA